MISTITSRSVNPSVFRIASSGTRSRIDCIISAPVANSSAKNTAAVDAVHDEIEVADPLHLGLRQFLLRLRVGLVRGVREQAVDLQADLRRRATRRSPAR